MVLERPTDRTTKWKEHETLSVAQWLAKRDPSRLVNAASGGNFYRGAGHIADNHNYPA